MQVAFYTRSAEKPNCHPSYQQTKSTTGITSRSKCRRTLGIPNGLSACPQSSLTVSGQVSWKPEFFLRPRLLVFFWRHSLTTQSWQAWSSLCRRSCPQTHTDVHFYLMLRLKAYDTYLLGQAYISYISFFPFLFYFSWLFETAFTCVDLGFLELTL